MKKLIVFGIVALLLAGLAVTSVSASFWESNFWGDIDAKMDGNVIVIGKEIMSDDEIDKKLMELFAEPLPMPTPEPEPVPVPVIDWYSYYYGNDDWLGCP